MATPLLSTVVLALHLPIAAQVAPVTPTVPNTPVTVDAIEQDVLDHAILLLSGYHGIPTAEELAQAFDDPRAVMLHIAQSDDVSPIHRDRAIGALAYWPSPEVRTLYTQLLAEPNTPEMVRHRVIGHVAVAFGDDALEIVTPYLESDDLQFRLTAVHALGQIGTPAAMQRLETAASVEPSDIVLRQIGEIEQQITR